MPALNALTRDADFATLYNQDGTLAQTGGVKIGVLKEEARLVALQSNPKFAGNRHKEPSMGISGGGYIVVVFEGRLCVRFFKQGGYTPNYGPVTLEDAKGLMNGTLKVKYIKGTSRFTVMPA